MRKSIRIRINRSLTRSTSLFYHPSSLSHLLHSAPRSVSITLPLRLSPRTHHHSRFVSTILPLSNPSPLLFLTPRFMAGVIQVGLKKEKTVPSGIVPPTSSPVPIPVPVEPLPIPITNLTPSTTPMHMVSPRPPPVSTPVPFSARPSVEEFLAYPGFSKLLGREVADAILAEQRRQVTQ